MCLCVWGRDDQSGRADGLWEGTSRSSRSLLAWHALDGEDGAEHEDHHHGEHDPHDRARPFRALCDHDDGVDEDDEEE